MANARYGILWRAIVCNTGGGCLMALVPGEGWEQVRMV